MSLGEFLAWRLGREDLFEGVGVVACIPCFGGVGHRCWREVLYLFEVEVEVLRDDGEFSHISFVTARVGTDEVGDNLLTKVLLTVDTIEDTFKLFKLPKRRFTHQFQYTIAGMLRSNFQSSADMLTNEFMDIFFSGLICLFIITAMQQQVVTDTATNKAFFYARQRINGMIDVQ